MCTEVPTKHKCWNSVGVLNLGTPALNCGQALFNPAGTWPSKFQIWHVPWQVYPPARSTTFRWSKLWQISRDSTHTFWAILPTDEADNLKKAISHYIRILLAMFRQCRRDVGAWRTCQRTWKGSKAEIEKVAGVLAKMNALKKAVTIQSRKWSPPRLSSRSSMRSPWLESPICTRSVPNVYQMCAQIYKKRTKCVPNTYQKCTTCVSPVCPECPWKLPYRWIGHMFLGSSQLQIGWQPMHACTHIHEVTSSPMCSWEMPVEASSSDGTWIDPLAYRPTCNCASDEGWLQAWVKSVRTTSLNWSQSHCWTVVSHSPHLSQAPCTCPHSRKTEGLKEAQKEAKEVTKKSKKKSSKDREQEWNLYSRHSLSFCFLQFGLKKHLSKNWFRKPLKWKMQKKPDILTRAVSTGVFTNSVFLFMFWLKALWK